MMVGVMTVHSMAEGIGVGVSYTTFQKAWPSALSSCPGVGVWSAAGWSVFSSLPQPVLAVHAFIFVTQFEPLLPVGLGLAAGAMIWMAFAELLPDALEEASPAMIASTVLVAIGAMLAFQQFLRT
jgi:zinc transporter, ZIP family